MSIIYNDYNINVDDHEYVYLLFNRIYYRRKGQVRYLVKKPLSRNPRENQKLLYPSDTRLDFQAGM